MKLHARRHFSRRKATWGLAAAAGCALAAWLCLAPQGQARAGPQRWPGLQRDATEVLSARTENTKNYDNHDGTATYILSSGPLHYHDDNGWQEIDTTIRPSAADDAAYEMTRSIYQAFFSERFDGSEIVKLRRDGHAVMISPGALYWTNDAGARQLIAAPHTSRAQIDGNQITYPNAYGPGLDFVYHAQDIKLSKRVIIPALSAIPHIPVEITRGDHPALALDIFFETDQDVEILVEGSAWNHQPRSFSSRLEFRQAGKLLWFFAPPRAWDSSGRAVKGTARLSDHGGRVRLRLAFPFAWLRETTGPITLDPDTYYGETTDGYISGSDPDYATARATSSAFDTSSATDLYIGQVSQGGYTIYRSLLEFDTSAISGNVTQANLFMKMFQDWSFSDNFMVQIHKFDWSSPITAGNQEANYDGALASTYDADWRSSAGIGLAYYGSQDLDTAWVNTSGMTRYALLADKDFSATAPTGKEYLILYPQDAAIMTNRPYLEVTVSTNVAPDAPSSLGPGWLVTGLCNTDTTPTLQFTQSDSDGGDTLSFQIQIDDSSDFGSAVVDYQSASLAQGATSFTVGQAEGSGTYTAGAQGQTLSNADYYWRVRSHDGTEWGNWSTANGGSIAFEIAGSCPATVGPASAGACGGSDCDYNTIQSAINAAAPGAAITVFFNDDALTGQTNNDCYNEQVAIPSTLSNLTIEGASVDPASAACIAPSTAGSIVMINADGVTLKNLEISGRANNGAGGLNSAGSGGRAAPPSGNNGAGIYITGDNVTVQNCTVAFTYGDNIKWKGSVTGGVTIQGCYIHHSDHKRNIRIIGGDGHMVRNNLIHKGYGVLINDNAGSDINTVTVEKNIIQGWSYWEHLAGHASFPEERDASHGGGWRYYSDCVAGIWVADEVDDPATSITIQNNVIHGCWRGIRVRKAGTIRNNTIVNPFQLAAYDYDGTGDPAAVRDNTFGILLMSGFSGTIENNIVAVTDDNRANGKAVQTSTPYYTPGITGYGIGFENNSGSTSSATIRNNNVWGFVDTDGYSPLNYGADSASPSGLLDQNDATNISVDPGFAADTSDETNDGAGGCDADADDTRCYELYWDNFFLASVQGSTGSCHADIWPNTAGYVGFVDLSNSGSNDPATDDFSGLADCSRADDSSVSRVIDLGDTTAGMGNENHGGAPDYDLNVPNLGAFGRSDRASWSGSLRIVGIDVGDGGVKSGDASFSGPGLVQARTDGITEVNMWFNRPVSVSASNFTFQNYCDSAAVTAPTVSGGSAKPYKVSLTWPAGTLTNQGIYITAISDGGANKIADDVLGQDLDGEISDPDSGTIPSGDGTAGGDADFRVYSLVGDVDGDQDVDTTDRTAVNNKDGDTAPHLPEDVDGDGTVEGAASEDDYVAVDDRKAAYWVDSTADTDTATTLRYALNNVAANETIRFKINPFAPCNSSTVSVGSILPTLDDGGVTVDASVAGVILDGSSGSPGMDGLTISSNNNIIKGLQFKSFPADGIYITGSSNTIGGVYDGSAGNQLGEGCLISDNDVGVYITGASAAANKVQGCLIGTDLAGTSGLGNGGEGIVIDGAAASNTIGGDRNNGYGNTISASGSYGILVDGVGSDSNVIKGNYIGTDITGTVDLGNGLPAVKIQAGARSNIVGSITVGEENRIAYNGGGPQPEGIRLKDSNTDFNRWRGNVIYDNQAEAIDFATAGSNDGITLPSIDTVTTTQVDGSAADAGATVDVYTNTDGDSDCLVFVGSATADGSGDWTLSGLSLTTTEYVVAIQTDTSGNSSAVSSAVIIPF